VYPYNPYEEGNKQPWSYSFGSWGIEVGINQDTGEIKLVQLVGVYDCGRVINRLACEGQIEGSFSMGLGQACYEEIQLNDKGKVINGNFRDYRIPTFMDGPRNADLHIDFYERSLHAYGPNGAKGIGEVAMIPVISGIANAISSALDVELHDLPLTRERVLKTINEKNKKI
jgi:CO/xanthine dehydrogenase Mo-binding subunit